MFSKFDEEAKKVLVNMQKEMSDLKHPYIGSEHLFLSILKYGNECDIEKLNEYGVSYDSFRNELVNIVGKGREGNNFYLYTPLLRNIIENATLNATDSGKSMVSSTDLLFAIFEEGEGIAIRILLGMGVDIDGIYNSFSNSLVKSSNGSKLLIDEFGVSLNEKVLKGEVDPVVGRDREIERIIEILSRRTKNNPLLIGDAGVGKTAIVEEIARKIVNNDVPFTLRGKKIISVSMASLVAGTKYRGEFEERLSKILKELEENSNIIVFIDEIHTLVGAGGAEGAIDASNILKPALARGKIKVIGATTTEEYKKFIEEDKALSRRFQTVVVDEASLELTKNILIKLRPVYEEFHRVRISDEMIDKIIYLSDKYIYNRKMPDKAIDVLDEVCSKVAVLNNKKKNKVSDIDSNLEELRRKKNEAIISNKFNKAKEYREQEIALESKKNKLQIKSEKLSYKDITVKDVNDVVSLRSSVPIFDIKNDLVLKNFKKHLNKCVLGQEEAINNLYDVTKKIRFGNKNNKRPYSFLFVGPTGVGKTLLALEYAKYFYGPNSLIRLDMSEYKEAHSVSKLIGSPPGYVGYQDSKNIFEEVKDRPYSVILLDEIEKANRSVLNLFLQILDEGCCKNAKGDIIRFDNTIIIMTSNACNINDLGFTSDENVLKEEELKKVFSLEFLNRLNKVIYFNTMNYDSVKKIVMNGLNSLKNLYNGLLDDLKISSKVCENVIKKCDYNKYGARRINKIIEDELEGYIIDQILEGKREVYLV